MARIVSVSMTPPFLLFLSERLSRLLKKSDSCFDRLSTNGKSPTTSSLPPFALSLSKGERRVFQHPVRRGGRPGNPGHLSCTPHDRTFYRRGSLLDKEDK